MGIAYTQQKKTKEALKCFEEGFKRSRNNWRICENMMFLSIDNKDLNKLLIAINNMYSMEKHELLKPNIFYNMINIFLTNFEKFNEKQADYYKDKIYNIFEKYSMKTGTIPEIWDLYALFIESVELQTQKNNISEEDKQLYYRAIMELRLKQARSLMVAGWDKDEAIMTKVQKVINERIKPEIDRIKDKEYSNELVYFNKNIEDKIEKYYKLKEYEAEMNPK